MLIERWREPEADELQKKITEVRQIIQSYPMIPALKAIVAGHLDEPDWLRVRPPLTSLVPANQAGLLADLRKLGFSMSDSGAAA